IHGEKKHLKKHNEKTSPSSYRLATPLAIGVMARESFEDQEVADFLNEHYISIKVDRKERPDIDSVYMKVCQMMTGHGGWPLTIVMTPDQILCYAGTYFPKDNKYGMPGLMEAMKQLYHKYETDPDHIDEVSESVTNALEK